MRASNKSQRRGHSKIENHSLCVCHLNLMSLCHALSCPLPHTLAQVQVLALTQIIQDPQQNEMTQKLLFHCCLLGVMRLDRARRRPLGGALSRSSGSFIPREKRAEVVIRTIISFRGKEQRVGSPPGSLLMVRCHFLDIC